ncbi:MAG TPA: TSUP family transporter, partial [Vicinamibacterales bacterium]|nr:TSUP family transporter [Vicinamibacterales bacterium]
ELTGWVQRVRWGRGAAWVAGALSGMLGGLVGNQGGIRTAAMLGFDVPKESFIATSTAVALFVDGVRVPVYLYTQGRELLAIWQVVLAMTIAVVIGTLVGRMILGRISENVFRRLVSAFIFALGVSMLFVT